MSSNKGSIVKQVVAKIREDRFIKLIKDQYGDPYIAVNGDGTEVYEIGSEGFFDWLCSYTMDNFNDTVLINQQPKNVSETLRGVARKYGQEIRLELRTYLEKTDKGDVFWYDLGESAVKITRDGWSVVAYPPIMFRRYHNQSKQIMPKEDGDIWSLFDFIHVKDPDDQLLVIAFIVFAMVPVAGNKPLLALSGTAGSGKSEATKMIKALVDPTVPADLPPIHKVDELNKVALTNSVMAFDNLSSLETKIADQFCRLATGAGVRIRKLYETNSYITFEAIRMVIVNGISQVITQSDLLNRAIPIELAPFEKHTSDESEFREKFKQAKPFLLGAIFDLLSKAMEYYPTITRDNWPRMGSFAKWAYAVVASLDEKHTGEDFIKAYERVEKVQHDEAIQANPLAQAVIWLMSDKDIWDGTAAELLEDITYNAYKAPRDNHGDPGEPFVYAEEMKHYNKSPYWPKDPRSTATYLKKIIPDLKGIGIDVVMGDIIKGQKIIHLFNTELPKTKEAEKWLDSSYNGYDGTTERDHGKTLLDFYNDSSLSREPQYMLKPSESQSSQKPQSLPKEKASNS